jgi:NADP-dependent 3-hydroxy acid dehydrogenase YdfG
MNFNGKIAIVTGASEGIGKAIALEFAIRGAKVVLASRNINKLEQVKARIENNGGTAISVQTDVSIEKDCENLINKTVSTFGKIDILVNNAGNFYGEQILSN